MANHQRIPKNETARIVLDQLIAANGRQVPVWKIAKETGLTAGNVRKGIAFLRDELASVKGVRFISYTGSNGGVALTKSDDVAGKYVKLRSRIASKQLKRVLTGTINQMVEEADTPFQKREAESVKVHLERVIEDLERI